MATSIAGHLEKAGLVSLHTGALICKVTRETLKKRIVESGIEPAGEDAAGNPLYWIVDLAIATHGGRSGIAKGGEVSDPMKLPASQRDAWFRSEGRRLELEERAGRLGSVEEFAREFGDAARDFAQFLDTLPDVLERDANMTPEQVDVMHDTLREERQRLHDDLVKRRRAMGVDELDAKISKIG